MTSALTLELERLCYGGLDLVMRQMGEFDRIFAADTRAKLDVCRFRNLCWRQAVHARRN